VLYSIKIKQSAAKSLAKIREPDRGRLIAAIDRLAESPHAGSALKGEFAGLRRIRVGEFRIVFEVDDGVLVIVVVDIAHRRDVHR